MDFLEKAFDDHEMTTLARTLHNSKEYIEEIRHFLMQGYIIQTLKLITLELVYDNVIKQTSKQCVQ